MNWEKIIERLEYWYSIDQKHQKALNEYSRIVWPDTQAPIISTTCVESYIDGFTQDKEIKEWLGYYIYEIPMLKGDATVKDGKGIKYNFKKKSDVIRFFNNNYENNLNRK